MSPSLITACVWLVAANVIAMFPSKHSRWPAAYALIALGMPLLGWVFWQNGVWVGLAVLLAAASVLRWPVRYLVRWIVGLAARRAAG